MEIVANYVSEYIRSLEQSKEPILIEMEEYASINKVPIIEVEVARFLEFLVMLKKPKRILEIGTAIGYSSIIMNRAYPDSIITTIEIDEKNFLKAKEFIKRAGCEKNIDLIYADANDALDFITDEYDMIFMDAAKGLDKDEKDKEGKYIRRERYAGNMSRSFYVGKDITEKDIHGKYENGILMLDIPKKAPEKKVEEKKFVTIEG